MKLVLRSYSHHGHGMAQTAQAIGHEIVGVMEAEHTPQQNKE